MDIEFETETENETLADLLLETADFTRMETTEEFVNIHVKTYYGPLVIRRSLADNHIMFEAQ